MQSCSRRKTPYVKYTLDSVPAAAVAASCTEWFRFCYHGDARTGRCGAGGWGGAKVLEGHACNGARHHRPRDDGGRTVAPAAGFRSGKWSHIRAVPTGKCADLTRLGAVWGICVDRVAVDDPFGTLRNYLTVPNAVPFYPLWVPPMLEVRAQARAHTERR